MIPETTDTGSAFSYLESSSVGQSVVPDGGVGALEAFTGPVYSLVAALLEQDMAGAPRDKRGHRFLELFCLSNANSFQVTVLCDPAVCTSVEKYMRSGPHLFFSSFFSLLSLLVLFTPVVR